MHIVLVYHERLPVDRYGGTPRVVVWLARGLVELGHQVSLIGPPGSRLPEARLIPVDSKAIGKRGFDVRPHLPKGAEILHAHIPFEPTDLPSLWTMHGNPTGGTYPANMVCLSADHARRLRSRTFVHNGLDQREYRFSAVKQPFDLFLGRLSSAKGWQWAVEGARRSGQSLIVAGGWRPSLRPGLKFVGEIGGDRKHDLLADAACLWMPAQWEEPFGLTLIEALASGTPVLGTRRGSLPEIITPEVGALGNTLDDLVAARPALVGIDPEACRARVQRHFSHLAMAEAYLAVYRHLLDTGTLPAHL